MKTTIEIPDRLFRQAKSEAAQRGQSLKELFSEALHEKLRSTVKATGSGEPIWMGGFGKLRRLRRETRRIEKKIHDTFELVEPEDRA